MSYRFTQEGQERAKNFSNSLNEQNQIDFNFLREGAERNAEKRAEEQRQIREKETARQQAEQEEVNSLMSKVGQSISSESKTKADAAIEEEIAKAEADIKTKQNKLHNVKEETAIDKAFRSLIKGMTEQ